MNNFVFQALRRPPIPDEYTHDITTTHRCVPPSIRAPGVKGLSPTAFGSRVSTSPATAVPAVTCKAFILYPDQIESDPFGIPLQAASMWGKDDAEMRGKGEEGKKEEKNEHEWWDPGFGQVEWGGDESEWLEEIGHTIRMVGMAPVTTFQMIGQSLQDAFSEDPRPPEDGGRQGRNA